MITDADREDVLFACRYGDLDDLKAFVTKFGAEPLADIRDENNNSVLHMVCGNGHLDILDHLLPLIPPSLLSAQNSAKSTPLHWAAINKHLPIVQKLVEYPGGPGVDLIDVKNSAGHTPLGEAEMAEWDEGAIWLVKMMNLDAKGVQEQEPIDETSDLGDSGELPQDIEVEIQDAEGQVAKMTINAAPRQS